MSERLSQGWLLCHNHLGYIYMQAYQLRTIMSVKITLKCIKFAPKIWKFIKKITQPPLN